MAYKTNLTNNDATFATMMENGFGIVTVMNAKVYEAMPEEYLNKTAYQVVEYLTKQEVLCELDTLKIANVTEEGPTKTITGGKYSNALVKFGKSARLEMQDALGSAKAIEYFCGGIREWTGGLSNYVNGLSGLHFGEDFQGPKTIVGESFFIDRVTGKQVDVNIIFYQFLPDSIFNLTQDAEGDATVFDMNGDLLTTEIILGTNEANNDGEPHGVFYSILPATPVTEVDPETPSVVETKISPDWDGSMEGWEIVVDIENTKMITVTGPNNQFELGGGTAPVLNGSLYTSIKSIKEGDVVNLNGRDFPTNGYKITIGNKNRTWSSM